MKETGIYFIILGIALIIASFMVPLTVGDTYNIGKIHISNSLLLLGGFFFISSMILFVGHSITFKIEASKQKEFKEEVDSNEFETR